MLQDIHLVAEKLVEKPAINTANVHTIPNDFQILLFLDMPFLYNAINMSFKSTSPIP